TVHLPHKWKSPFPPTTREIHENTHLHRTPRGLHLPPRARRQSGRTPRERTHGREVRRRRRRTRRLHRGAAPAAIQSPRPLPTQRAEPQRRRRRRTRTREEARFGGTPRHRLPTRGTEGIPRSARPPDREGDE